MILNKKALIKFAAMLWENGHLRTYYDDLDYDAFLEELIESLEEEK